MPPDAAMVSIAPLRREDIDEIAAAFARLGWHKPASQYERYLEEAVVGVRTTWVARFGGVFAGYATVCWSPDHPPFRDAGIPEIQDLNVLPEFRRRGIGSRLMDTAEACVGSRGRRVGIAVGFDPDYGPAQRMYVVRGYVPDGRGGASHGAPVRWGDTVTVDDDLLLHIVKTLPGG